MKEIEYLKGVFGDDWKKGMRENPHIDRPDPHAKAKAEARKQETRQRAMKESLHESLDGMYQAGRMDKQKYVNLKTLTDKI